MCDPSPSGTGVLNASSTRLAIDPSFAAQLTSAQYSAVLEALNTGFRNWNDTNCNQGSDDFANVHVIQGTAPNGWNAAMSQYTVTVLYENIADTACARYRGPEESNPAKRHTLVFYRQIAGNYKCEVARLIDKIAAGQPPDHGGASTNLELLAEHEAGHILGLGESFDQSCAMGPQAHFGIGDNKHMRKTNFGIHGNECKGLDALANSNEELAAECAADPTKCTGSVAPPTGAPTNIEGRPKEDAPTWGPVFPSGGPPSIDDFGGQGLTPNVTVSGKYYFCFWAGAFPVCLKL